MLNIATGHVNLQNLAIGATVSASGFGFSPKAVLFNGFGSASTGSGGGAGSTSLNLGAASAAGSWSTSIWGQAGVPTNIVSQHEERTTGACINRISGVGTFNTRAVLQSLDADGFTLQEVDTASPNVALFYQYLALAGAGLRVTTGVVISPDAAGNQAITGLGFRPKGIIFSSVAGVIDTPGTHTRLTQGFAAPNPAAPGSIVNAMALTQSQNGGTLVANYNRVGDSLGNINTSVATLFELGRVLSFDSDGFTIEWDKVLGPSTDLGYCFLAFGGNIECEVGGVVADGLVNGNQTSVSGLSGRPEVILLASNSSAAANAYDTPNSGGSGSTIGQVSLGWSTGPGDSFCSAELVNANGGFGATNSQRYEGDGCMAFPQNSGLLGNAFDMASIEDDGFTLEAQQVNVAANRFTAFMTLRSADGGYNAPHLGTD